MVLRGITTLEPLWISNPSYRGFLVLIDHHTNHISQLTRECLIRAGASRNQGEVESSQGLINLKATQGETSEMTSTRSTMHLDMTPEAGEMCTLSSHLIRAIAVILVRASAILTVRARVSEIMLLAAQASADHTMTQKASLTECTSMMKRSAGSKVRGNLLVDTVAGKWSTRTCLVAACNQLTPTRASRTTSMTTLPRLAGMLVSRPHTTSSHKYDYMNI